MLVNFIGVAALYTVAFAAPLNNSTPATTKQHVNIFESAIFVCGDYVFRDSLAMLFPPSDESLPNIRNTTRSKIVHIQSYQHFCSKINVYKACVQLLVNRSISPVDDQLKHYIDLKQFPTAMDKFCSNETMVTDQFECTKTQSESNRCPHGGIYGIMSYVSMAIQNGLPKRQYCDEFQASIQCRVEKQLKPCNIEYAELMEVVYKTLVHNICKL